MSRRSTSRRRLSSPDRNVQSQMEAETERCELCSGNDITFTTPQQWNSEGACSVATSLALSLTSLVCQACRRDISRVSSDPSFIPRWEKIKFKVKHVYTTYLNQPLFQHTIVPIRLLEAACNESEMSSSELVQITARE